jgi:hypothetical protein
MPRNRLRRAAGIAPWGVTPKAARGESVYFKASQDFWMSSATAWADLPPE